jgi:hypothetical protein
MHDLLEGNANKALPAMHIINPAHECSANGKKASCRIGKSKFSL